MGDGAMVRWCDGAMVPWCDRGSPCMPNVISDWRDCLTNRRLVATLPDVAGIPSACY